MNSSQILELASKSLQSLSGQVIDVLTIHKPTNIDYAKHLTRVISKLSPLVGNMIEYSIVEYLNKETSWTKIGKWVRQDPGFPDTLFIGNVDPKPGIEVKTWFPLATEITARFKDSYALCSKQNTNVAVVAWLPEYIIYGRPKIIDVWIDTSLSLCVARDAHYNNPPDYLVFEPEDTSKRTINLQQTNTNGFKFQGTQAQLKEAEKLVKEWGLNGKKYTYSSEYQNKLKSLLGKFPYRLDTNFAKIDRIRHPSLEKYKQRVITTEILGSNVAQWMEVINSEGDVRLKKYLFKTLGK